jgi:glutamate racemase
MLDSGVGGLSILREVRRQLPDEDVLYLADQRHVPYGRAPATRSAASRQASPASF